MKHYPLFFVLVSLGFFYSCDNINTTKHQTKKQLVSEIDSSGKLPPPHASKSSKLFCEVVGWKETEKPTAPEGFYVNKFAEGLTNPRNIYVAANGDIFIAEANTELNFPKKIVAKIIGIGKSQNFDESADRITLLRDTNNDGNADYKNVFLKGLNLPYGITIINNFFYVANTDGLLQFPYQIGQTSIKAKGKKILQFTEGGYNNHWTRNLLVKNDGSKIFITVGSSSNVAEHGMEHEIRRANILEINPDGSGEKIYASGLRNPAGLSFNPETNILWTAVNERDDLGDELVPDYLTSVKENGFYGWPYSYFGQNADPSFNGELRPDLIDKAIVPEVKLGAHTASLGLAFYDKNIFPEKYQNGAFVGQHGSWNSSKLVGYKVVFVPFKNGKPSGPPEDFLTGFIDDKLEHTVHGRPVGIAVLKDGSILVADDAANTIWRISYRKNK